MARNGKARILNFGKHPFLVISPILPLDDVGPFVFCWRLLAPPDPFVRLDFWVLPPLDVDPLCDLVVDFFGIVSPFPYAFLIIRYSPLGCIHQPGSVYLRHLGEEKSKVRLRIRDIVPGLGSDVKTSLDLLAVNMITTMELLSRGWAPISWRWDDITIIFIVTI
jgi:hypothetical protein